MKKFVSIILVLSLLLSLYACGSVPEGMTKETYEIGKQAIKVMDKYLNGKISATDAELQLAKLYYEDAESEKKAIENALNLADSDIEKKTELIMSDFYLSGVCMDILGFLMGMDSGDISDCKECRDTLYNTINGE